jgi:hypothetical protein
MTTETMNTTLRIKCLEIVSTCGILVCATLHVGAQYDQYVWQTHRSTAVNAPSEFTEELDRQIGLILAAGRLRPGYFYYADLVENDGYWLYWEPGRIITTLAYAYPFVTPVTQAAIRNYVNAELAISSRTPWTSTPALLPDGSARREWYAMDRPWHWDHFWSRDGNSRPATRVAMLYGLWLYAYNSGDWTPIANNWNAIKNYYSANVGAAGLYGTMGAHIAMARMAFQQGDTAMQITATNNAINAFNTGLNFTTIENNSKTWYNPLYDTRRSEGVYHGQMFLNMCPEVGRYIADNATLRSAVLNRHESGKRRFSPWHIVRCPVFCRWTGDEGVGAPPELIGMIFPVERWVVQPGTTAIASYHMHAACNGIGDCYAIEALVHSISAFGTDTWQDVRSTGPANIPPTCALTSPVNNSTYTAPANIVLSATAADSDGSVVSVAFYRGSTLLFTDTSSPYSYTWTGVSSGTYQLSAVATDNQGATGMSAVVTITVVSTGLPVNQPPTVALTSPVTGSSYTAPANITLAATASDADGSIAAVRFYSGTTLLNLDNASPYTYTWTGVSSGTYQLYATATDNQGAVSTSAVVNVTVYPPNQPPTVTMTSPVNNSTYTAPATLNLAATASDPDGSVASVRFYRGSTLLNTDSASPYEYTWTNVSSGTYQLRAVAQDNQGATSTSTVVTVTVLSSSTPAVWYTLTATANPANGGTVTPASGTYLAGSQIQVTATPNANYTFATWSGDASGTNPTVTLTMDSDKSITANFTYVPPANSSPVVTSPARMTAPLSPRRRASRSPPQRPTVTAASPRCGSTPGRRCLPPTAPVPTATPGRVCLQAATS